MARSPLTVQTITRTGIVPALTAANVDGHSVSNRGQMFLDVANGSGSSITVTLVTTAEVEGRAVTDDTVTIAAGVTKRIGPFAEHVYSSSLSVNFSAVTDVTVGAFAL